MGSDHGRIIALVDSNIIQREVIIAKYLPVRFDVQQVAAIQRKLLVHYSVDGGGYIVLVHAGQKAQAAKIDTDDRYPRIAYQAYHIQQRTIAANGKEHIDKTFQRSAFFKYLVWGGN